MATEEETPRGSCCAKMVPSAHRVRPGVPDREERATPAFDVRRVPAVALSFMNDDHHLEACLVNELVNVLERHRAGDAGKGTVVEAIEALVAHTAEHFRREESAMEGAGFPSFALHAAEHDSVLAELRAEARLFRDGGDTTRLAAYLGGLPGRFVRHIQSMDAAAARFLAAR